MEKVILKQCTNQDCLKWLPATTEFFYKQKDNQMGLTALCKECTKRRSRKWQDDNREQYLNKKNEYRKKHLEKTNERARIWMRENKEQWKKYYNNWVQSEEGKVKVGQYFRKKYYNSTHKITKKEWVECKTFFDYRCAYCDFPEELHKELYGEQLHKEHYYHNGSNGIDNCIPACRTCNSTKHITNGDEWYTKENPVYTEDRQSKIEQWLISKGHELMLLLE